MKTIDAHGHFINTLVWGRQSTSSSSGAAGDKKVNGAGGADVSSEPEKLVSVVATGHVDKTIKIWLP